MRLNGQRVLVTGAGGFIGSHLVERLIERGCDVRAMVHYNSRSSWGHLERIASSRSAFEVIALDIRDPFAVDRAVEGCAVVFHLAALIAIPFSYTAPESYVATNINGTLNVLEACRRHRVVRMVHTSTSEAYGTALYSPIDERHPLQGQSPYSATKIGADKLVESYNRSFDLPVATLRPFNTFGPRQSARAIVPTIVTQAAAGTEIKLGLLSPVRDLMYVADTVSAFVAIAEADEAVGMVINAGTGVAYTVGEIAERILRLMGRDGTARIVTDELRVRPAQSEVFKLVCDNRLAQERLGWAPTVALDEGLKRTIEYIAEHRGDFKSELYNV